MAKKKKHSASRKKKKSLVNNPVFRVAVFVVLVAVVAALIILTSKSGELRLSKQNKIAATVNGEEITMAYLDEQYERVPPMYKSFITKSALLDQTINEMLLLQEAEKKGIVVSKEDVKREIDDSLQQAGITEEELDARLAAQNVTRDFLEELYRKQLTINKLLDDVVMSRIKVTDEEIEDFYDSRIRAMHILVDSEEEAYDIIEDLKKVPLNKIESTFSDIAKEKSIDPSAASNGGDLGEFSKGQMVPEFEQAAFALEEYAFTAEPIQTRFGYHIILRLPKKETLEQQWDAIKELLLNQKKAQTVPLYLEQLKGKADIEIFFKEEPAEEAPAAPSFQVSPQPSQPSTGNSGN